MQATPLWVTITGFVLGPAVVAAFLTYIFNKSLNKQKSSLDEVVQERLNEQKASLDKSVQSSLNEQKASLDKSVQSSLNEQKASLDEAVQRRLSEYAAARQEEHHRAERQRLLARRYLYQLGEAVDSLWYRVDNWANRGGASWSESRHPGYWEVTSLYVVARALGAERVLALEGVYVDLHELSSDKDPKLPERAVEEAVKNAFEPGLFYYHRLALAEAVLDRPGDEYRLLIYSEFLRRYENPEWNLQSLLEPARQAFGSLNIRRLETLKQSLAGLSECIKKLMT